MENLPPFILNIVDLWNIHRRRESLYKQALGLEDLGAIRRTFTQGFSSSLLFKKEIQWIYDQVKTSLIHGDIQGTRKSNKDFVFPWEDKIAIAFMLQEQEQRAIRIYKNLLSQKSILTLEAKSIFADHLVKIEDINHSLSKVVTKSIYSNGKLQYASDFYTTAPTHSS